jgi:hypothetical protein
VSSGARAGDLAVRAEVRAERERARFLLYLVRHRTSLKNRIRVDPVGLRGERRQTFRLTASAISTSQP